MFTVSLKYQIYMRKINRACFFALFFILSCMSKSQVGNEKGINTKAYSAENGSLFNTNKADCITLPFGYDNISKLTTVESALSAIQDENKLKEMSSLKFDKDIKKDLLLLPEEYNVFLPFSKNVNEKFDRIKIATDYLCYGEYSLYFIGVLNTVRYAEPYMEKIYLVSMKNNHLVDMKRIYLNHQGEMGFANYTLFNIDKNYIITLQDYEFTESPFKLKPLNKYQILPSGKFSGYYDHDGSYKDGEEQGIVKNHKKEGKWVEFKSNDHIDLKKYPEFTDSYTYLEAEYKNGLPVGKWKFYKLLQEYNEETGEPMVETRKKGKLIYTEMYKDGVVEKREFY